MLNEVNAGFAVGLAGYVAFLPLGRSRTTGTTVGQLRSFEVVSLNKETRNIVVGAVHPRDLAHSAPLAAPTAPQQERSAGTSRVGRRSWLTRVGSSAAALSVWWGKASDLPANAGVAAVAALGEGVGLKGVEVRSLGGNGEEAGEEERTPSRRGHRGGKGRNRPPKIVAAAVAAPAPPAVAPAAAQKARRRRQSSKDAAEKGEGE